ncbi:GTP cyclohydrolase [Amphritea atlantica]|uniref:GTP cyclohydrolase n=1 Tax=Amphritea atlantica TaxID=355243 RepID=A0ABY5GXE4_9GAMM|nr:GTP cyclohydrolase [Amphritea atlantica]
MYVVSLSYKVDLSEVDKYIEEHVAFLEKHYEKGNFIASGRKVPRTGGVILAHAESKESLMTILQEDPFFEADLANYEIIEFVPTKVAQGFESLKNFI